MRNPLQILIAFVIVGSGVCPLGCSQKQQGPPQAGASKAATWLTLDGLASDWEGVKPVLQEAGLPGRGDFNGFDVKQVYLKTDSQNLYIFVRCEPTVADRFEEQQTTGGLIDIYLDTDSRKDTGTSNKQASWSEGVPGSDRKIVMGTGVVADLLTHQSHPTATVTVFRWDQEGFSGSPIWETISDDANASVAYGANGVEAVIPLDALGLKAGAVVHMLLVENAHFSDDDAPNEMTFTVTGD